LGVIVHNHLLAPGRKIQASNENFFVTGSRSHKLAVKAGAVPPARYDLLP
jgi:hypothetical protein